MNKILITAPVYSQSGYGVHARTLIKALRDLFENSDYEFELFLNVTHWSKSSNIDDFDDFEFCRYMEKKFESAVQTGKATYDIHLQVAPVHEFKINAPVNIGFTALVETDRISNEYIHVMNKMSEIVVLSDFNIDVIKNSIINKMNNSLSVKKANYPFVEFETGKKLDLNLTTSFNFLTVCQISPRKNFDATVLSFIDAFGDNEDVGLICKVHGYNGSTLDFYSMKEYLQNVKDKHKDMKCKLYLLHGDMSQEQMMSLYTDDRIHCLISTTRGESWGLPLFEAACAGLPIIAPNYSGQRDFLVIKDGKKETLMFSDVEYKLKPIDEKAVWDKVLIKDSLWADVNLHSVKKRMIEITKDYSRFKSRAKKLSDHLREKFSKNNVFSDYKNVICKYLTTQQVSSDLITI
jgi:glycosyltransferase involved in cell wall biosynthesis